MAVAVFCFTGVSFGAFLLEPPIIIFNASVNEKVAWVEVVHTGGPPMAVELSVVDRRVDMDGENVTTGLNRAPHFAVNPAQVILRPGQRQRVQVVYSGPGRVTSDKTYNLFSREVMLPIGDDDEGVRTGINTLVSYYTVIAFETGRPGSLTFVSSRALGGGMIEVIVENRSRGRVQGGDNLVITIGGNEKIRAFTGKKNSILPGERRRFTFPYSRAVTGREITFGAN
jgi:P pilus assembly chaperone PapD